MWVTRSALLSYNTASGRGSTVGEGTVGEDADTAWGCQCKAEVLVATPNSGYPRVLNSAERE